MSYFQDECNFHPLKLMHLNNSRLEQLNYVLQIRRKLENIFLFLTNFHFIYLSRYQRITRIFSGSDQMKKDIFHRSSTSRSICADNFKVLNKGMRITCYWWAYSFISHWHWIAKRTWITSSMANTYMLRFTSKTSWLTWNKLWTTRSKWTTITETIRKW